MPCSRSQSIQVREPRCKLGVAAHTNSFVNTRHSPCCGRITSTLFWFGVAGWMTLFETVALLAQPGLALVTIIVILQSLSIPKHWEETSWARQGNSNSWLLLRVCMTNSPGWAMQCGWLLDQVWRGGARETKNQVPDSKKTKAAGEQPAPTSWEK